MNINFRNYYNKKDDMSPKDSYHTINELYAHRTLLFALICNQNSNISWKSRVHKDETMFDDMFIAGINTPKGQYTYHCELKFWEVFKIKELDKAPVWDGHKPEDIGRLFSLLS